jgi:thiol-disulfide isomerase/thioredoxin
MPSLRPAALAPLVLLACTATGFAAEPAAKAEPSPAVRVDVQSWDGLQKFVALQEDRVVVVDVWSTWCAPCVRELPHLVALQAKHPKQVTTVSFCLDYSGAKGVEPASLKPQVLEVLRKFRATGTRNLLSSDADETVYDRLELGSVPAVFVYREGQLVKRFDNDNGTYGDEGFTYEDHVTPFVGKLLADEPSQSRSE